MGHGNRQVLDQLLMPFKAAVDLGGVRGVMMAYSEVDDIPAPVSPMLYDALENWGYDGFVMSDDAGTTCPYSSPGCLSALIKQRRNG